jgi:hypothetical protein
VDRGFYADVLVPVGRGRSIRGRRHALRRVRPAYPRSQRQGNAMTPQSADRVYDWLLRVALAALSIVCVVALARTLLGRP